MRRTVERHAIIRAVTKGSARVALLIAPGGFGKTLAARQIAARYPARGYCDCTGVNSVRQLATKLLAALREIEPHRAPVLAQNGIALAREGGDDGDLFNLALHTFSQLSVRSALVIDNAEHLRRSDVAHAMETVLRDENPNCTIVVCARPPLAVRCARAVPPNELLTLSSDQLRFSSDEIRQVLGYYNLPPHTLSELAQKTTGWPSVLALVENMLRSEPVDDVLAKLNAPLRDVQERLLEEVLERLEPHVHRAVLAVVGLRNASVEDLERLEPGRGGETAKTLRERIPLLTYDSAREAFHAHAWLMRSVLPRYAEQARSAVLAIAQSYETSGDFISAARAYLAVSDVRRVAECLERAPLETFSTPPVMEMIVDLGGRVLAEHPKLWYCSIPYRRFAIDPETLLAEARELYRRIDTPDQVSRGIAFLNALLALDAGDAGHVETALEWLRKHGDGSVDLQTFQLMHEGTLHGRFDEAAYRELRAACPSPALHALLEGWRAQALVVQADWHSAAESLRTALADAQRAQGILRVSRVRAQMHFHAWLRGDDVAAGRLLDEIDAELLPYQHRSFRAYTAAVRAHSIEPLQGRMTAQWRAAGALVVAGSIASPERAGAAVRYALAEADQSRDAFMQVLARASLALLDAGQAPVLLEQARNLAERAGSPALCGDLARLTGEGNLRLLEHVRRRFSQHRGPRIVIDVFSQDVWRGGERISLSERARELLFTLALNDGSVRSVELQTLLWPTLPPEKAANALKAAVHRLRAQMRESAFLQPSGSAYTLADGAAIDEATLRRVLAAAEENGVITEQTAAKLAAAGALLSERVLHRLRRKYARLQGRIASALAAHALQNGKFGLARKYATMMLELDPYDERAYALVITALTRSGDAAAANAMYAAYRNAMSEAGLQANTGFEELVIPALTLRRAIE